MRAHLENPQACSRETHGSLAVSPSQPPLVLAQRAPTPLTPPSGSERGNAASSWGRGGFLHLLVVPPCSGKEEHPNHTPHAPLWGSAMGWRKPQVTQPTDSPSSLVVGHPRLAAGPGARGTHNPPHTPTGGPHPLQKNKGAPLCPDPVP